MDELVAVCSDGGARKRGQGPLIHSVTCRPLGPRLPISGSLPVTTPCHSCPARLLCLLPSRLHRPAPVELRPLMLSHLPQCSQLLFSAVCRGSHTPSPARRHAASTVTDQPDVSRPASVARVPFGPQYRTGNGSLQASIQMLSSALPKSARLKSSPHRSGDRSPDALPPPFPYTLLLLPVSSDYYLTSLSSGTFANKRNDFTHRC